MMASLSCSKYGRLLAILILISVIVMDQLTKHYALAYFAQQGEVFSVTSFLRIVLIFNPGISFGLLNFGHASGAFALSILAGIITVVLIIWLWRAQRFVLQIALGFVSGGAIGNIIDRIRFKAVVDFIDFHWLTWHFPAFNVADTAVTIGVGLMILDHLRVTNKGV